MDWLKARQHGVAKRLGAARRTGMRRGFDPVMRGSCYPNLSASTKMRWDGRPGLWTSEPLEKPARGFRKFLLANKLFLRYIRRYERSGEPERVRNDGSADHDSSWGRCVRGADLAG